MAAHKLILLLMTANSMALANSYIGMKSFFSGRARATECTEPGLFCESCTDSYFCSAAGATPLMIACDAEQVCGGNAPASGCLNYIGTSAGDCDCDTIGNVGFLADPFDSTKYVMCIPPEGQFALECPAGEVFSAEDNGCVEDTTTAPPTDDSTVSQVDSSIDCTTENVGFYTNDPTCQTYTACYIANLPGLLLSCADGEAFDTSKFQCVPQCDLAPATFECTTGASGAFPDTSDCTIFHVCSNGAAVTPSTGVPCPDGQVFEPTTMLCVAFSSDAVCPEINSCYAAYCDSCGGTCPETLTTGPSDSSTVSLTTEPADTTTAEETDAPTVNEPTTTDSTTTTFKCAAGASGSFPDPSDCTILHVCSNGVALTPSTGVACPNEQLFDSTTSSCVPSTCPEITSCGGKCTTSLVTEQTTAIVTSPEPTTPNPTTTSKPTTTPVPTTTPEPTTTPTTTSSTTTTTTTPAAPTTTEATTTAAASGPPNCNNSPGYYEETSDCKQFWSCQSDDEGGYEAILYRCPGSLVYIPANNYCSFQSDLPAAPGCIAS